MDDNYDFKEENSRIAELMEHAQAGDVTAMVETAREATQFELSNPILWFFMAILMIRALAEFIRRTGDAVRPITEVVADKMREVDDERKDS